MASVSNSLMVSAGEAGEAGGAGGAAAALAPADTGDSTPVTSALVRAAAAAPIFPSDWKTNKTVTPDYVASRLGTFEGIPCHAYGSPAVLPSLVAHITPIGKSTKESFSDVFFPMESYKVVICCVPGCKRSSS